MKTKLGNFEGRKVEAGALKLGGTVSDRVGHLELDEPVFMIIKGTVSNVSHGDVKETFTRLHKVRASAMVILEAEDGERMLDEAQMIADDRFGVENLFRQKASHAVGQDVDGDTGEIKE
jgi:hypothetical protein